MTTKEASEISLNGLTLSEEYIQSDNHSETTTQSSQSNGNFSSSPTIHNIHTRNSLHTNTSSPKSSNRNKALLSPSRQLSHDQLVLQIATMQNEIHNILHENSILQKFIDVKTIELGIDEDDKKNKKKKRNHNNILLTAEHKYDISNTIHDVYNIEIEDHRKISEKMIDTLYSVLEETNIHINELKHDAYEFKRDIVIHGEDKHSGKIIGEKVISYYHNKSKSIFLIISKLQLKLNELKIKINKINKQLNMKSQFNDNIHYIDFHQLKIDNKNYLLKLKLKINELIKLKNHVNRIFDVYLILKNELNKEIELQVYIKNEINMKSKLLQQLQYDLQKHSIKSNQLIKQDEFIEKNDIHDITLKSNIHYYIIQKKEYYELKSELMNWKKKIELQENIFQSSKRLFSKTRTMSQSLRSGGDPSQP